MTDLGGAAPVSDRLMGRDPAWADEGLAAWAVAVARLHDGGAERARTYAELLAECAPEQPAHAMPATLEAGATALARTAATLGVTAVEPALTRLRELPEHFAVTRLVLSPGDPCPDNNVAEAVGPARGGSVLLLDFEYAEARHPAWDVAYLTVPWPTCWCSWGLPRGSSERAVNAYLERAGLADDQAFAHDLALATQGWSLATAGRLLNPALEDDEWDVQEMPGPRPRAWQRLETAAAEGADEALATLAAELMAALQERWGPTSLPLAPAYRRNGRSTERR
jgi:hypothetical protein